jgi:NAD(P)-dependent dehydrogenase (short-subunit alcohol dehydrogenase family)
VSTEGARDAFRLDGKVAVVTGAVGLLGQAHARALMQAGAAVVVADLDVARCGALANELTQSEATRQAGKAVVEAMGVALDVTDAESVDRATRAVLSRHGRIDVLVNNAAINDMVEDPRLGPEASRFESYSVDHFRRMLDVNVTGTFLCSQRIGREMAERGAGSIINIASTYGLVAPDQSLYVAPDGTRTFYKSAAYPATKGAVIAFTRFLAAYWGHAGVRCNTLTPGGVENAQAEWFVERYSERTPLGRMARAGDIASALVFLASDASAYVTGANLVVDGGFTAW